MPVNELEDYPPHIKVEAKMKLTQAAMSKRVSCELKVFGLKRDYSLKWMLNSPIVSPSPHSRSFSCVPFSPPGSSLSDTYTTSVDSVFSAGIIIILRLHLIIKK